MRIQYVLSASLAMFAFACGGDDDGGGPVVGDDDGTPVDMAPSSQAVIGKVCTSNADCPSAAPQCVGLEAGGTMFCTAVCGTSTDAMMPPANGDAACDAADPNSTATPACALSTQPNMGTITWACGLLCGPFDNMGQTVELGTCPSGLTCVENFCE